MKNYTLEQLEDLIDSGIQIDDIETRWALDELIDRAAEMEQLIRKFSAFEDDNRCGCGLCVTARESRAMLNRISL